MKKKIIKLQDQVDKLENYVKNLKKEKKKFKSEVQKEHDLCVTMEKAVTRTIGTKIIFLKYFRFYFILHLYVFGLFILFIVNEKTKLSGKIQRKLFRLKSNS